MLNSELSPRQRIIIDRPHAWAFSVDDEVNFLSCHSNCKISQCLGQRWHDARFEVRVLQFSFTWAIWWKFVALVEGYLTRDHKEGSYRNWGSKFRLICAFQINLGVVPLHWSIDSGEFSSFLIFHFLTIVTFPHKMTLQEQQRVSYCVIAHPRSQLGNEQPSGTECPLHLRWRRREMQKWEQWIICCILPHPYTRLIDWSTQMKIDQLKN